MHQRQALALAGRQVHRAERAVLDRDLVRDLQPLQVGQRALRQAAALPGLGGQVLEQVEVREHRRVELAVVVAGLVGHRPAVRQHLALLRRVQPQQQLDQRGLARAVVADDEHHLPAPQRQVHRPEHEGLAAVGRRETVAHAAQLDRLGQRGRLAGLVQVQEGLGRREARRHVRDALEGHPRPADARHRRGDLVQRAFQEQQHQHEAAEHRWRHRAERRPAQDQRDQQEEQRRAEGRRQHVGVDGAPVDLADAVDRALDLPAVHAGAARAVHAQLLGAVADGAVGLVQLLLGVAGLVEALDAARLGPGLHAHAHDQGHQQQPEQRR